MRLQEDIRSLAGALGEGGTPDRGATLILGAAVGAAAGVPSFDELASRAGLSSTGPVDRRVVERLLWEVPVPPFYYDVASLVRDGYFPRVITTGYDDLLERALSDAGLRRGNHFATVDLASSSRAIAPPPSARIRIVRCRDASVIPQSVMARALGDTVGRDGDRVVSVGYGFEAPALEGWLGSLRGAEMWWVAEGGEGEARSRIRWAGEWHTLEGDSTAPSAFFGQLALLLLHLPTTGAYTSPGDGPTTAPGDDELDALYLQGRINQANVVKRSIEQRTTSAGVDPAALTQLTAQASELSRLQEEASAATPEPVTDSPPPNPAVAVLERYRPLRDRLARLVDDPSTPVDSDTLAFIDGQLGALEREATKAEPNAPIVAAASAALDGLLGQVGIDAGQQAR